MVNTSRMDREDSPSTYAPERALEDIPAIKHAEELFLNSAMAESEEYCLSIDPRKERLYVTSGYSLIQCLKALMSYEDKDLEDAKVAVTYGNNLANHHRAPSASILSSLAGLLWDNTASNVARFMAMTPTQRHAELLYAETLFAKASLGVVCSGSWLSFISEALNFRTMINTYLSLGKILAYIDASPDKSLAEAIDADFRSGVELGVGASNLILSLMPDRLIAVAEIFGYRGNRDEGLMMLMKIGGWVKGESEPKVGAKEEGCRRSLADVCLLCFHLVISTVTFKGVDIDMAQIMLDWNLKRFPDGIFFLLARGRLLLLRTHPRKAIESYYRALSVLTPSTSTFSDNGNSKGPPTDSAIKAQAIAIPSQYTSFTFLTNWELAIAHLSIYDTQTSLIHWRVLLGEKIRAEVGDLPQTSVGSESGVAEGSTWSRACYAYGTAICLMDDQSYGSDKQAQKTVRTLMERMPQLVNRIAGKSIPMEKFVARKARKYLAQSTLTLPALEFAYSFQCLGYTPRRILAEKILPKVEAEIKGLEEKEGKRGHAGTSEKRWDDLCLAWFLQGVCYRYLAYPEPVARPDPSEPEITLPLSKDHYASRSKTSFERVLRHREDIVLEHYLIYHTHYELGRLYACIDELTKAREYYSIVLSGRPLEKDPSARKGKYSLQSALMMRTTAAVEALE